MEYVKFFHVLMAFLSITGFITRGIWMMQQSAYLRQKWVKILPHIIDSLLLLSAIYMAVSLAINPLEQAWLMSKIIALLIYIALGMVALRFGQSMQQRKIAWLLAIIVFLYIVLVAFTKQNLPLTL
ncbi:hypothetical protein MNBD_GAMMA22-370 [hydrothermal vent metagenome]|uniref:Regulator SirB n=1 Tax=hydrothermal vent metagenome TaxID=652676 RepID=A0A3B1AV64_9ZZZZ